MKSRLIINLKKLYYINNTMSTLIQTFVGNIGIGTNDPGAYKLRVDGAVRANSLEVNGVSNVHVPIGLIAMWYGTVATIPTGWALCDGTTGIARSDGSGTIDTPNLANRFVRGADGDEPTSPAVPGQTSGANTVTLATTNLPTHSHTVTVDTANANHNHNTNNNATPHSHGVNNTNAPHNHTTKASGTPHSHGWKHGSNRGEGYYQAVAGMVGANRRYPWTDNGGSVVNSSGPHGHNTVTGYAPHSHNTHNSQAPHSHGVASALAPHDHTASSGEVGDGTAITVTNPYYILAYIMKI
jgi:microcystin-dependent protein